MSHSLRLPAWLCGLLLACPASYAQDVDLVYLFSDGQMPVTSQAYKDLLAEHPELREQVRIHFITESVFDEVDVEAVVNADVLVLDIMNQQMLDRFNEKHGTDLIKGISAGGDVMAVGLGLLPKEHYIELGATWDDRAQAYWQNSGAANHLGLMKTALTMAGVSGLLLPEPVAGLNFGYYYADGDQGRVFASWEDFDEFRTAAGKTMPGSPRIAIGFYKSNYYTGDTEALDALIAEVERQGAEAIPFFGYPAAQAFERMLIDEAGDPRADAGLSFLFRFADFQSAETLGKLDIPVLSLITLYGRSEKEWRSSSSGLSIFEGTFQVAVPELAGLVAPTVVGSREKVISPETGLTVIRTRPIASRLPVAVARALAYASLRVKDNADKKLALIYYSYPPGRAGIGASYLNVADSLANILRSLSEAGYDVGDQDFSSDAVLAEITQKARNIGSYAPGELAAMLEQGDAVHVGIDEYRGWLDLLAPQLKDKILGDWGDPEDVELMSIREDGRVSLIVPLVRFGNIVLMPQPARGWAEDKEKLYHAKDLSPHHQYVAAYAWLQNRFGADAIVHLGTHGTLEWLDGKDIGQSREDATDALLGSLPDLYIYNVDVIGEGLVARRRGMATLVDHMVPPFTQGGLYAELALLDERIDDYYSNLQKNSVLAAAYAKEIRELVVALGIAKDLDLDVSGLAIVGQAQEADHDLLHEVVGYMIDLRSQNIPYGLHAFGRVPDDTARASTVNAIVSADRSLLPDAIEIMSADMDERIIQSANRELDNLIASLNGSFIPVGTGGEPIRNPHAYPTGKNFFGLDPDKVPKLAAWKLGVELAELMLKRHVTDNGAWPQKVSFVIWGDETMRHEGILESQILYLLGTRPVWDARGKLVDVEVIPSIELKRPRVDIVIASAAEGMFNNVTLLMDKAVQMVKAIDEPDNYVRDHYLATREALIGLGYSEEDADRRAGVRIFDEPPGTYNLNTSKIVGASGTWDTDQGIAYDYIRKMGHGFGNGFWGEPMADTFRLALSGTEKIVHSSSTMLYGALDNDDFYMYMGGLASAVKSIDGNSPELVVANTRDPGNPKMSSINEFIGSEFRSRYVNPTWIEGMQKEGYAGAAEMRAFVEYLWGWDATVTDTVDDAMWQQTFEVYVEDKYELNMQAFFEESSPFAFQEMSARMMETIRKGYWGADQATRRTLLQRYISSVNQHGIGCSENTCGNPLLMEFVVYESAAAGVAPAEVGKFRSAIEDATRDKIENLAASARAFVRQNEARIAGLQAAIPDASTAELTLESAELQSFQQQTMGDIYPHADTEAGSQQARPDRLLLWWAAVAAALALLFGIRGYRRR